MKLEQTPDVVIIDDDPLNNLLCEKIIELTMRDIVVNTFTVPEKGLEYIRSTCCSDTGGKDSFLFLNINMPSLTGWDVLEKIEDFSAHVKEHLKIFMLSSSVNPNDKEKADNNPLVSGYVVKPLSQVKFKAIFSKYVKS